MQPLATTLMMSQIAFSRPEADTSPTTSLSNLKKLDNMATIAIPLNYCSELIIKYLKIER